VGLDATVDSVQQAYYGTTRSLYDDLTEWNMISAEAQAGAEAAYAQAGADNVAGVVVATVAGVANLGVQSYAAYVKQTRERDIDYASVAFQSELQKADNKLTVNQARQQVDQIARERLANNLELTDN